MKKLMRMIGPLSLWEPSFNITDKNLVKADTLTDLKTKDNEISVWAVQNEDEYPKIIQALASGFGQLDTITLIALDEDQISESLSINDKEGTTIVKDINPAHRNIEKLDVQTLGELAVYIIKELKKSPIPTLEYNPDQIKNILIQGIREKKYSINQLQKGVKSAIAKEIDKQIRLKSLKTTDFAEEELRLVAAILKENKTSSPCKKRKECESYKAS